MGCNVKLQRTAARKRLGTVDTGSVIALAFVLAIVLKAFVLDLIIISGDSMSPTIRTGSVALVARCAYGLKLPGTAGYLLSWAEPRPGDIVCVEPVSGGSRRAIKRVFETGPAFVRAEGGVLTGRGGSASLGPQPSARLAGPSYVPAGRVFLLGDNGGHSYDSRDYGSVPIETVAGKVLLYSGGHIRPAVHTGGVKDSAADGG